MINKDYISLLLIHIMEEKKKNNYKKYIEENEEIRCWFKVSSNRKKVWNIQLGLLEELKRICKKYNIRYYAYWGTLLWAIRHWWYIPWDDDMDIAMFREDYEKFWEVAKKELPNDIELMSFFRWFSKLINLKTAAFWDESWKNAYFNWGIRIDIFPMDWASKFMIINQFKAKIMSILDSILFLQKRNRPIDNVPKWKHPFIYICKLIFWKIGFLRTCKIQEKIIKSIIFEWNNIRMFCDRYFPKSIFNKSYDVKFEKTTICIPDSYDRFLTITYGDYKKPIIYEWWHNCRYSVNESYKNIVRWFDESKWDEENYNNCKSLFIL